ncbi:MAG: hypothetical protein RLZZ414_252 [Bacteroidota bacterium]|jgi:hypothetical protein
MATVYLSELEGKQLFLKKGAVIPLYKEPIFGGVPDRYEKYVRDKSGKLVKKPMNIFYNTAKSALTIGKLVEYGGVKYFTNSSGYLIPATTTWFNIAPAMKSGQIKTVEQREKQKEEKEIKEQKNSWYNIASEKLITLFVVGVGGLYLLNKSKNGKNK